MTIRQRLLANLGTTLGLFVFSYGVMFWGALRYDHLQKGTNVVDRQVQNWLALNFQVSQYLKKGLEAIVSGQKIREDDITPLTDEIIHTFINLEKSSREKKGYLSSSELEDQGRQLVAARSQFGLIHAELEKAIPINNEGKRNDALRLITERIVRAKLDQNFIEVIADALSKEKAQANRLEASQKELRTELITLASIIAAVTLILSVLLIGGISRSVQRSIDYAKSTLLKGTQAVGSGNLENRIDYQSNDELSVVAQAFNKMSQDLKGAWQVIGQQQQQIVVSSKMSALGEMAAGIAHEVNNPLAVIKNVASQVQEVLEDDPLDKSMVREMAHEIEKTANRIGKIVQGLRAFSRDGSRDPFQLVHVGQLMDDTLGFCSERFKSHGVDFITQPAPAHLTFEGRGVEVSQVILNLLNNAHDAVENLSEKWVKVEINEQGEFIEFSVTDSGPGIPPEVRNKLFQPFFTTKEVGKGTGLGLSVSVGIIQGHGGELKLDDQCPNTRFVVRLPKRQSKLMAGKAAA